MADNVEVKGLQETLQNLAELPQDILRGATRGLNQWSEETMTEAKERTPVDPVDGGTLRASGYVTPPEVSGDSITQDLGFGGAAADYALVQHERLDFHHTTGQAKFLESAVNDRERELLPGVAAEIEREIK